jgi:hypothetical protein
VRGFYSGFIRHEKPDLKTKMTQLISGIFFNDFSSDITFLIPFLAKTNNRRKWIIPQANT